MMVYTGTPCNPKQTQHTPTHHTLTVAPSVPYGSMMSFIHCRKHVVAVIFLKILRPSIATVGVGAAGEVKREMTCLLLARTIGGGAGEDFSTDFFSIYSSACSLGWKHILHTWYIHIYTVRVTSDHLARQKNAIN